MMNPGQVIPTLKFDTNESKKSLETPLNDLYPHRGQYIPKKRRNENLVLAAPE